MHLLINGGLVDLYDLTTDDIHTVPLARALARINRFAGNFNSITVAQHAVIVSNVVEQFGGTLVEQLAGLHHDDSEAIIGDIPYDIKAECPAFISIENGVLDVIDDKYKCKTRGPLVQKADKVVGNSELAFHIEEDCTARMMADLKDTDAGNGFHITALTLVPWTEDEAFARYLDRHDELLRALALEAKRVIDMAKPPELGTGVN